MLKYAHRIILVLNKMLLIHSDIKRKNQKNIAKPCPTKINEILNDNLNLFENIMACSTEVPVLELSNLKVEDFERLIKFYGEQLLPLLSIIGLYNSKVSNMVDTATDQVMLLEKANELLDLAYIHLSEEESRSNDLFITQYGEIKNALAEKLDNLGFDGDAKQLKIRAQLIINTTSTEHIISGLEITGQPEFYGEAA